MEALLIPFGIFLAAGLFLILAEALKIPTVMTMRAMSSAGKREKKKGRSLEMFLMDGAVLAGRHLPMNPHKMARLGATLRAAGMDPWHP